MHFLSCSVALGFVISLHAQERCKPLILDGAIQGIKLNAKLRAQVCSDAVTLSVLLNVSFVPVTLKMNIPWPLMVGDT